MLAVLAESGPRTPVRPVPLELAPPSVPPISGTAADASSATHTSGSELTPAAAQFPSLARVYRAADESAAGADLAVVGRAHRRRWGVVQMGMHGRDDAGDMHLLLGSGPAFRSERRGCAPGAPPAQLLRLRLIPAVLAQQAYQQIPIPKPDIHFGPHPDLVAVNIPVWLWISKVTGGAGDRDGRQCFGDGHARR